MAGCYFLYPESPDARMLIYPCDHCQTSEDGGTSSLRTSRSIRFENETLCFRDSLIQLRTPASNSLCCLKCRSHPPWGDGGSRSIEPDGAAPLRECERETIVDQVRTGDLLVSPVSALSKKYIEPGLMPAGWTVAVSSGKRADGFPESVHDPFPGKSNCRTTHLSGAAVERRERVVIAV